MGELRVREIDVSTVDQFLKAMQTRHGPAAAKTAKSVTSLLLALAVRHKALSANPVRDSTKIPSGKRSRPWALTVDEQVELVKKFEVDEVAQDQDVVDLVEFMFSTGVRIGEALGVRRAVVDVTASVVEINAKAAHRKGQGAVLEERTKSDAGWRVIALPDHIVDLCVKRMGMSWPRNERGLLFPTRMGDVRLPTNADRALRDVLDRIGFEWVTSHTFRKTVATRLDQAGLSARAIADHLGHAAPSMTQDVYMARRVASPRAAVALEVLAHAPDDESRG
jgi:integrase